MVFTWALLTLVTDWRLSKRALRPNVLEPGKADWIGFHHSEADPDDAELPPGVGRRGRIG